MIIATTRALLVFAERELGSTTAAVCLATLAPSAADRLARELADERSFGPAKSLCVQGERAGYDMTSERGIAAFVESLVPAGRGANKKAKVQKAKTPRSKRPSSKTLSSKTPSSRAPPSKAAKPKPPKTKTSKSAKKRIGRQPNR